MNGRTAYVQHVHKHDHGHEHDHDHDYEKDVAYAHSGSGGKDMLEGLLLGMCQKSGIDPGLIALMKDKERDGLLGGGSGLLVLLFLIILLGGRGFGGFSRDGCHDGGGHHGGYGGWGGGYGGPGIVNQIDFKVLLDAIERKGLAQEIAMKELATNLHVSFDSVKQSIANLDKGHALVEGRIGHMDASIKCAIKECCCEMRLAVERSTNILSREICETNHRIDKGFCDTNANVDNKFCQLERRMDDKFCNVEKLIIATDTNNRIRELEESKARLAEQVFMNSQNEQTNRILHALKCEPKRVCFDERNPCEDRRRRDRDEDEGIKINFAPVIKLSDRDEDDDDRKHKGDRDREKERR